MTFRFYLTGVQIVPKPVRMSRARRNLQSPRAQKYLENQELIAWAIKEQVIYDRLEKGRTFPMEPPLSLSMVYCMRSRRKQDRTNIEKSIEDALVKAGVIEDDNVKVVPDSERIVIRQGQNENWLCVELRPVKNHIVDPLIQQMKIIGEWERHRRKPR